jgi:hypothetical protein
MMGEMMGGMIRQSTLACRGMVVIFTLPKCFEQLSIMRSEHSAERDLDIFI